MINSVLDQHIHSNSAATPVQADYSAVHTRNTSAGLDDIPYRIFTDCTSLSSEDIAALINYSINNGCVPSAWKRSLQSIAQSQTLWIRCFQFLLSGASTPY